MVQQSIYASREGALYQSYDNYAGASGFYDPAQDMPPQQLMNTSGTPMAAASLLFLLSPFVSSTRTRRDPGE